MSWGNEFSYPPCPHCGEHKARASMRRGFLDLLLRLISIHPYRCRGCRRRFYRFGSAPPEPEAHD
ncbi:MAG: hypothetical protein HYR60_04570 [Acidobacteria bacterium]|nr:hypothetical protein [Acidobacteriota bacterium]MBI3473504.1 hypothetical protein [Candidatus Solibacter usitatus]